MKRKSIRPTNRVQVGGEVGQVRKCGKRKQGGAWVPTYEVTYRATGAVRTVRADLVRRAPAVV